MKSLLWLLFSVCISDQWQDLHCYPITFANNLFCLFRPCRQLFSIFFIPLSKKIMVRPLSIRIWLVKSRRSNSLNLYTSTFKVSREKSTPEKKKTKKKNSQLRFIVLLPGGRLTFKPQAAKYCGKLHREFVPFVKSVCMNRTYLEL